LTRPRSIVLLAILALAAHAEAATQPDYDLCVYGGTSAGVMAAAQMSDMGGTALVVEPGQHLGGLTAGGLGATDIGNAGVIGGLSRQFYDRVARYYAQTYGEDSQQVKDCYGGFRFEPHVAEAVMGAFVSERNIPVWFGECLGRVRIRGGRIDALVLQSGKRVTARVFIDATYEGDLMAAAGVTYTVGREANAAYGETYDGVQAGRQTHQFTVPTSPYRRRDDPSSGLLWGISSDGPGTNGEGDKRVQAYNLRMCLTADPANQVPFSAPPDYDRSRYLLLARWLHRRGPGEVPYHSIMMPNGKTDTNNNEPFSTDYIGMNYDWPEADWDTRAGIFQDHLVYQQGLMYFLATDPAVPLAIRRETARWGLAADEFTSTDNWPHQLYVREGRRMVSDYVMTDRNCLGTETAPDVVAMGAYNMDSHNTQRYVADGRVLNEGDVQIRLPGPYPISYRSIVPRRGECGNLLVPVAVSASHIAYGSIRMEPVFMVLGQSAAAAAWFAAHDGVAVQDVDVPRLQERLKADGQVLEYTPPAEESPVAPLIDPKSMPGIVLDDSEAEKVGTWVASASASARRVGTGYVHDDDARDGNAGLTYKLEIPDAGRYELFLISPPHPNRATRVPVTVTVDGADPVTLFVNQRGAADGSDTNNGYATLGIHDLPAGAKLSVTITDTGTDGYVVADGLQVLRREP